MNIKKVILLLVIVFAIGAVFLSLNWRDDRAIEKITISGNYTITRDEILSVARLKDSLINLNEINIDIIQDRISKHPEIKKVFVSKVLPSELKVEIIERRPVAILSTGNELKLIDDELEVFPFKNYSKLYDLPVISGVRTESNPNQKSKFNKEDLRLALFMILNSYRESKVMYNNISEINLSDSSKVIVYMSEDSSPFFFPRMMNESIADEDYQNLILNRLQIFDNYLKQLLDIHLKNHVNYVDLRFSNHVIVNYN